jgi:hypothetical protein
VEMPHGLCGKNLKGEALLPVDFQKLNSNSNILLKYLIRPLYQA